MIDDQDVSWAQLRQVHSAQRAVYESTIGFMESQGHQEDCGGQNILMIPDVPASVIESLRAYYLGEMRGERQGA